MAGRIDQEFDSIEIDALNSWFSERMKATPSGQALRGKPAPKDGRSWIAGETLNARGADIKFQSVNEYLASIEKARAATSSASSVARVAAGSISKAGYAAVNAVQVAQSAVSRAGLGQAVPGAVGAISGLALGGLTAAGALVVAAALAQRMARMEGAMESLIASRGAAHPSVQNPFLRWQNGDGLSFNDKSLFTNIGFAAEYTAAHVSSGIARLQSLAEGQTEAGGIPMNRARQAYWAAFKQMPPVTYRWNKLEYARWDDQMNRGEDEFLGWRKTPQRVGN